MITFLKILSISTFVILLWVFDWEKGVSLLSGIETSYLVAFLVLLFSSHLLKIIRTSLLSEKKKISELVSIAEACVFPTILGLTTPGKIGDLTKIFYLTKLGIPANKAFTIWFNERAFDMLTYLSLCTVVLIHFFIKPIGLGTAIILTILAYYSGSILLTLSISSIMKWFKNSHILNTFKFRNSKILFSGALERPNRIFHALTITAFSFNCLQLYFLAKSLGIDISIQNMAYSHAVATIISLIPITFFGLGLRELSYMSMLGLFGINKEAAITISLLDGLFFAYISLAITAFFLLTLRYLLKR